MSTPCIERVVVMGHPDPSSLVACLKDVLQEFAEKSFLEGKRYQGFVLNVSNSALSVRFSSVNG